ncbi:MAG TPA: tetratricopeptide repeat protein [Oculatellaceae cyanobacterium]
MPDKETPQDNVWALFMRGNFRNKAAVYGALVMIVSLLVMASVLVYAYIPNHSMKVQLIAEKRNNPVAWAGMAHELEQKGDLIDAERAYRKAIQLKPDYKPAWLGLGEILEKQGQSADAEAAFKRAAELQSDPKK